MPTLLITGANRGLGLEFVRQYAADEWDVIATCRNPSKAEQLQLLAEKNKKIQIEELDVEDFDAIQKLGIKFENLTLNLLINNAGTLSGKDNSNTVLKAERDQNFPSVDTEVWQKVMRVNALGPLKISEAFFRQLGMSGDGKIIMISNLWGSLSQRKNSFPSLYAYNTSKTALNAITKSLALDLEDEGTYVTALHPGWVETDMMGAVTGLTVEESVQKMRKVIGNLSRKDSGQFLNYDGTLIQW